MITGVGKAMPPDLVKWDNPNRPITASGKFQLNTTLFLISNFI